MSFRRKEDPLYQISFDNSNQTDFTNGMDYTSKSSTEITNLYGEVLKGGIHGFCFSLYEDGQKPGDIISEEQVRRRMEIIAPYTKWVRSFSCTEGNEFIPIIAREFGIKTLVGAWLGNDPEVNEREIEGLIKLSNEGYVDIAAVGNEVMYRKDLSEDELLVFIGRVKKAIPEIIPVGYVDAYYEFTIKPRITAACDLILTNCYPFWEGCNLEYSLGHMKQMYHQALHAGNGKKVIITETGWPSKGESFKDSHPSEANAMKYFINAQQWSKQEDIDIFYFSSFDESWKVGAEGEVGAYWGIWDKNEKKNMLNSFKALKLDPGSAICYSGFREGQQPGGIYPSYEEVKEDLMLLQPHWKYLRLYDCDEHAETVLKVIEQEKLPFQIMLGAYIVAEMNNFGCPWGGGVYTEVALAENRIQNLRQIKKLIHLANQYPTIICTLSAGNEACVDWTDHYVSVSSVIQYVKLIKKEAKQPVTFCENYVPWLGKLKHLADAVDFISIHTYPVWEYKNIHEALEYTKENYWAVANRYPGKTVVITEAGWATNSNGRGIEPHNVSEENQEIYYHDLVNWTDSEGILTFIFEAFDETWKGSHEPFEPEKHWGLFKIDRTPKLVMEKQIGIKN